MGKGKTAWTTSLKVVQAILVVLIKEKSFSGVDFPKESR